MKSFLEPWHLLLLILAGWINHRQQNAIECTANPDDLWMLQVVRNLSDADYGFLRGKKYLLMDRDTSPPTRSGRSSSRPAYKPCSC
jgi:hypothetical protein